MGGFVWAVSDMADFGKENSYGGFVWWICMADWVKSV